MIDKVGGIVIKDKKVLVVRKKTKENFLEFIIPGGKRESGETDLETLQREMQEEVNLKIIKTEYLGEYRDIAIFENIPIAMKVYLCEVEENKFLQNRSHFYPLLFIIFIDPTKFFYFILYGYFSLHLTQIYFHGNGN